MFIGELHPYQKEAVERFISRKSLLIAFGCGTGKTVMAIAAAEKLMKAEEVKQVLILCPASLKYQWRDKILQFTDSTVVVIDGTADKRGVQFRHIVPDAQYIIHSYESVLYDYENMSALDHRMTICDEVSAIKSFKAKKSKRVKKMFRTPYRMGLTATPIENRPEELYSIMQWVDDTVLGRYDLFERAYIKRNSRGWVTSYQNLDVLFGRMGDALARKTRFDPDVRPYLPDVDEDNWTVPMTDPIARIYKAIAMDMVDEMTRLTFSDKVDLTAYYNGVDESTPPGRLMAMHMCMEMLLDHPDLIVESGQKYMNDSPEGSEYAYGLWQAGELDEIFDSAKFDMLVDELTIILSDPKSKVLVFSKYKYMLELIQHDLPYKYKKNWGNVIFNGDMSAKAKEAAKKEFTENPDCRIFLSSYAGGYGQDMYMADYLVNYDLPWSFGMQDQINSRHVRVSSEFDKIYIRNMITEWSVEERKQRILTRKRQISRLAIDGQASNSNAVPMDDDFLKDHLDFVLTSPAWHGKISKWGEN